MSHNSHYRTDLSPEVNKRMALERRVVTAFLNEALAAGYSVAVNNGGDDDELPPSRKRTEIMSAMFATDDEHLILYKEGKRVGWVWFVYGNDGWDAISDYTTNLEPLMKGVDVITAKYS